MLFTGKTKQNDDIVYIVIGGKYSFKFVFRWDTMYTIEKITYT